jgi:hypothetical protein
MSPVGRFCCRSRRRRERGGWCGVRRLPSDYLAWDGRGPKGCRPPQPLCKARFCDRRWSDDKLCEPSEVLRDCRQCELELGAAWPTQAQTTEPEDALEMGKQHLNSFAIAARAIECFGLIQRPGYVTGLLAASTECAPARAAESGQRATISKDGLREKSSLTSLRRARRGKGRQPQEQVAS